MICIVWFSGAVDSHISAPGSLQQDVPGNVELDRIRVSLWVSVKAKVEDIGYDLEALAERQVIEYARREKGPMLC